MIQRRRVLALTLVVVLAGATFFVAGSRGQEKPKAGVAPSVAPPVALGDATAGVGPIVGTVSCGGRNCHGRLEANLEPGSLRLDEFMTWGAHDKHKDAYNALLSERAQRMADRLAAGREDGKKIPAHEDVRCLACHVTPQLATAPHSKLRDLLLHDGVGCESCHGPANGPKPWLQAHMQFKDVRKDWDAQAKKFADHGMIHLQDVNEQVKVCVGCHVGAGAWDGLPQRDAYHDLMAAGHPRLTFEFTAYRDNLPPHWRTPHHTQEYEARSWAIGQVATARASIDLLEDRMNRPKENAVWPEFAEYDCFSCHAGLTNDSWKTPLYKARKEKDKGYKRGTPPYSVWASTLLPKVTRTTDLAVLSAYEDLGLAMSRNLPDKATVAEKLKKVRGDLDALGKKVDNTKYNASDITAMLKNLADFDDDAVARMTWEEAQQLTLAIAALKLKDDNTRPRLAHVNELLAYPAPDGESPNLFRRDAKKSDTDEPRINKALRELRKALP